MLARPGYLTACLKRSVTRFETYSNVDQPFHPGKKKDDPGPAGAAFCAGLKHGPGLPGDATLDFEYVDREIVPSRTKPSAVFSDGSPARTQPRIDALLVNRHDRMPIAAEVKVKGDKTPFIALIQGLAGAAQLATASQRERLRTHYPAAHFPAGDSHMDIYLIFVNPPAVGRYRATLLAQARELAAGVEGKGAIRRIVFIHATSSPVSLERWQPVPADA